MAKQLDSKFVAVRHPSSDGDVVYKFSNRPLIPEDLLDHDKLIFQSVDSASELTGMELDRSNIAEDSDVADLMREHWGIDEFE